MGGLLTWWNLIYLIPLFIALLYLGLSVTFGLFDGGDSDHDAEHEIEHDVDHEVVLDHDHDADLDPAFDHDHDADLGTDVGHGLDHDHDHTHDHGPGQHGHGSDPLALLLWAIGARNVTAGLALQLFLINWGALGLLFNALLSPLIGIPWLMMGTSLVLTSIISVGVTRLATTALGRLLPKDESAAEGRAALEGRAGTCLWEVDANSGAVVVQDRFGSRHQVAARTAGPAIPRGAEVVLVEYVAARDYFMVEYVADLLRSNGQPAKERLDGVSAGEAAEVADQRL